MCLIFKKCQQRRRWATEEDLEAEDIDDVEETHTPTLNTIPFSRALLLEAKAEIATRSTATRIQNECSVDEEIINLSVLPPIFLMRKWLLIFFIASIR